jgi:hypothetical protein
MRVIGEVHKLIETRGPFIQFTTFQLGGKPFNSFKYTIVPSA